MICGHDDTQRATLTEKRGPTFMTDGRKRASGLEAADIGSGLRPKNIGARVKRVEDPRLLTGQGAFTADRLVPGAMHVAFRRSDHAHAIISSINTSAAAEMPGVFAIYTAQELDDLVKPVRASSRMENYHATTLYPLARERVRYVGEPVVVVLAENRYLAEDARDQIEIAYEALAIVIDPEIAVRADAPLLHVEAGTNVLAMREFARGDIGAEMTAAPMRVGGRFRFHRKTPIAIENRACLAERNLIRADEFPYKVASGIVWDRSGFMESLTSASAAICYARLREEQTKARAEGRLVGIGIATYAELTGIGSRISAAPGMPINTGTESATIRLDSTGAVTGSFGIASHGQGLETTLAQVIADELGVRIEDIRILHGDSAVVAHGTGTYASRSAVLAGGAATLAARLLKEKVIRAASHLLEASVEDIEAVDGRVFVAGTDRSLTFREIAKAVYSEMGRLPRDAREELEVTKVYDPYFGTTTSATHIVALEIDPETYKVELDRYVVAEDCGHMINPMIVDGQVHGAVAQGIGAALYEEVIYDAAGQLLTASLADYAIPTASEMPSIATVHLEAESPSTTGGFRGMGEGGTIGAPAAIANALADALAPLGAEIFELPMTPERLFRLIEKARAQGESQ
jgi:CO/xanthine dehydrogenase Mo-binding subunit